MVSVADSSVRAQVAPANPAQVTGFDAVCQILAELQYEGGGFRDRDIEPIAQRIFAAIGAGGQAVADDIGDAVLAWMVKYDLLDGDNEYQVADVMAVMDDLVPSSALSQPHPADERVVEALRIAHSFIAREYRDEKSLALEGEFVSKEARPVFSALSEALAALTTEGRKNG